MQRGIEQGVLRSTLEPEQVASIMVSTLEGAYMLTRLYGDSAYLDRAIEHLHTLIEETIKA